MALELIAPAKLNLSLEIIGRRPDGYHDIVSVMQTIDLADHVCLHDASSLEIEVSGEQQLGVPRDGPRNLAFRAAQALAAAAGLTNFGARIELDKNIPPGMGLGGGSTDAAAVLRGLCVLWRLDLDAFTLNDVAASVGSDVPFFLHGGTALVTGRGDRIEPLPDAAPLVFTLFAADVHIEDKTRRMYSAITPADFTDGNRGRLLADSIRRGVPVAETSFFNAFDRHIDATAEPHAHALSLCMDAGIPVIASGSGPAFFSPTPLDAIPAALLHELERDVGVRAVACRSLSRAEATAIREV